MHRGSPFGDLGRGDRTGEQMDDDGTSDVIPFVRSGLYSMLVFVVVGAALLVEERHHITQSIA